MSQTTDTTSTFEFFQGTLSESSTSPRVTVRRGGLMVITRAAVDLLGDDVSRVQLAYNRKTGDVGIRAASDDMPGSYLLRTQPKSPSRLVSGKRFFQHHSLPVEKAQTFPVREFGNGIIGFQFQDVPEEEQTSVPKAAPATRKATARKRKSAA